ncbi:hypothetical protein MBLNU230_g2897t1 [Neophaeotheca triangularis]
MASVRGKGKQRATAPPRSSRRRTAGSRKSPEAGPNVYDEMLAEAAAAESPEPAPPLKRRKVVKEQPLASPARVPEIKVTDEPASDIAHRPQTVEDSSEDEDSDFAFEDVDLDEPVAESSSREDDRIGDISVSIDPTSALKGLSPAKAKRKPPTAVEKAARVLMHKTDVLCLLAHCIRVNSWCNNSIVHGRLLSLLDEKTKKYLVPKSSFSQFRRNQSFMEGLEKACESFSLQFSVTESSMSTARWKTTDANVPPTHAKPEPAERKNFMRAAKSLKGSQDTGNQLFCALLRAAGVEARLICSLQPFPFGTSEIKAPTPKKPRKSTVFAIAPDRDLSAGDISTDDASVKSSTSIGKVPTARRRLGQPSFAPEPALPRAPPNPKRKILKLAYPVFWVEAFDEAHQKWIPVDPVVTNTLNKSSKLEPPSSYAHNQMSYVIAFEDDCVARDVTRRYAKAYNAKTRKQRVESTGEEGTRWWRRVMRFFRRCGVLDRDQVEDAELSHKEAREGMPTNVLDFKGHPHYALERHLKRHEVLHPRNRVGKVNAGTPAKPRMEEIFRRRDVLLCKTGDKWYRLGRVIKPGEQPLKHLVAARARRGRSPQDGEEPDDVARTALYAPFQTSVYLPDPVVDGRVPRNNYGNLEIHVPSMIPPGAAHVKHGLAQKAAKLLRVDFADAVTGFQFKGRQGTAVIEGIIVAAENEAAVHAVIEGFEQEVEDDQYQARSFEALRQWKRFLVGLRVRERISEYGDGKEVDVRNEIDKAEDEEDKTVESGGFFPDEGADQVALPTAGRFSLGDAVTASRSIKAKSKARARQNSESGSEAGGDTRYEDNRESSAPTRRLPKRAATGRTVVEDDEDEDDEEDEQRPAVNASGPNADRLVASEGGGGFFPEDEPAVSPTNERRSDPNNGPTYETEGGGFLIDEDAPDNVQGVPIEMGKRHASNDDASHALPQLDGNGDDAALRGSHSEHGLDEEELFGSATAPSEERTTAEVTELWEPQLGRTQCEVDDAPVDERGSLPSSNPNSASPSRPEDVVPEQASEDVMMAGAAPVTGSRMQAEAGEEEDSDKGSMLSHDPEDSDAEPDWLADGD